MFMLAFASLNVQTHKSLPFPVLGYPTFYEEISMQTNATHAPTTAVDLAFLGQIGVPQDISQTTHDELRANGIKTFAELCDVRASKSAWEGMKLPGLSRARIEAAVPVASTRKEDSGDVLARLAERQEREAQRPWLAVYRHHLEFTEEEKMTDVQQRDFIVNLAATKLLTEADVLYVVAPLVASPASKQFYACMFIRNREWTIRVKKHNLHQLSLATEEWRQANGHKVVALPWPLYPVNIDDKFTRHNEDMLLLVTESAQPSGAGTSTSVVPRLVPDIFRRDNAAPHGGAPYLLVEGPDKDGRYAVDAAAIASVTNNHDAAIQELRRKNEVQRRELASLNARLREGVHQERTSDYQARGRGGAERGGRSHGGRGHFRRGPQGGGTDDLHDANDRQPPPYQTAATSSAAAAASTPSRGFQNSP
jgi:hypothetical protein